MKERLVTALCALGALALFLMMFVHRESGDSARDISRPNSREAGRNGYRAAAEWLTEQHIVTRSVRERFATLAQQPDLPATGNVLLVTVPATTSFKTEEFRALNRWVRAGNTLVVLAALSDNPDWAAAAGSLAASDLDLLTGLDFETQRARDARTGRMKEVAQVRPQPGAPSDVASPAATSHRLVPNRKHAYFAGVRDCVALSDTAARPWAVKVPYDGFVFTLAHDAMTGNGVMWTRPLGEGRVVISGFGSLFTNRALGMADNARLLANIIGVNRSAAGAVLFDDIHQGLAVSYDPDKFWRDSRLHVTIVILCALWLSWVLGATRLRVPATQEVAPREAELVQSMGGFLARVVSPVSAARRMVDLFARKLPRHSSSQGSESSVSSLQGLAGHTRLEPADVRQMQAWVQRLEQFKPVPLVPLHNLIVKINGMLDS